MKAIKATIETLLKAKFKPEFLNRIDEIIMFNRLGKPEILKIVDIQLDALKDRLKENKLILEISKGAKEYLAKEGYDPMFGARPLKRTIQNLIQNPLAKKIIAGEYKEGDTIHIDTGESGLTFTKKMLSAP